MNKIQLFLVLIVMFFLAGCGQSETRPPVDESQQQEEPEEQKIETEEKSEKAENEPEEENKEVKKNQDKEKQEKTPEEKPAVPDSKEPEQVENPESILVLVNKNNLLPSEYEPSDLVKPDVPFYFEEDLPKRYMREEAAKALEKLFEASEAEGLNLVAASGYRAYARQKQLYEGYVEQMGQEAADKVSAFPGASEHQTGLAMDVTSPEMGYGLAESFGETKEGKWLADNAYKYGFIIRYPEGRTADTGYSYEPWHIRYIGKEAAGEIYKKGWIFEEYKEAQ